MGSGLGSESATGFSDQDFDDTFNDFEKNNSGKIEKAEMVEFIKKCSGME